MKKKNEKENLQLLHFYKFDHKNYIIEFLEFSSGRIYDSHKQDTSSYEVIGG